MKIKTLKLAQQWFEGNDYDTVYIEGKNITVLIPGTGHFLGISKDEIRYRASLMKESIREGEYYEH